MRLKCLAISIDRRRRYSHLIIISNLVSFMRLPSSSIVTLLVIALLIPLSAHTKRLLNEHPLHSGGLRPGATLKPVSLLDSNNKPVSLQAYSEDKKLTIITVFATWCTNCRLELPQIEKLYQKHQDQGLAVVGVSIDKDDSKLQNYLKGRNLSFPILKDANNELQRLLNIQGVPLTVILDKNQSVLFSLKGTSTNLHKLIPLWLTQ